MKYKFIYILLILTLLVPNLFALIPAGDMKIFAVSGEDSAQAANLNIKVVDGTGKIFSSIDESIVGSATQESFKNAIAVTENIIGNNINKKYDFTLDIESNAYSIDGPSAGGAMALLLISMFKDEIFNPSVSITGAITVDGYIGDVGGIYQKAKKAGEIGIKLFFIPQGNRMQVINEDDEIEQIDLVDYAYENWGLKVIEVSKIENILEYAFDDINSIDINIDKKEVIDDFIYDSINYSEAVTPLKQITADYIKVTEEKLVKAKAELTTSTIKDTSVLQNLLSTINYSEELLNISKKYNENNYFYSAANNSFLAYVNIITVDEIITNPSILSDSSIVFDLRLSSLEDKIKITENRSTNCALSSLEWCVGARQRITWARDKLEKIQLTTPISNFSKIQDYAYAVAWAEISNSFLDVSVTNSGVKFVESNHFKERAQQNIIAVENQLVLVSPDLTNNDDLKRRLDASKRNFERGWYVTSLYDSASALAVIKTQEDTKNNISVNDFNIKYDDLVSKLRSQSAMSNENNVWSKIFLDHAIYYYKSFNANKFTNESKAKSQMSISNSILNFSNYLYEVESVVLDYYLNTDLDELVIDISNTTDASLVIVDTTKDTNQISSQNVYVYSKEKKDIYLYVVVFGLFLMIVAIVVEVEKFKRNHSKEGLIKQIGYLDSKLLEGKISPFTYKEMRDKYLFELQKIKNKEYLKENKKDLVYSSEKVMDTANELERRVIETQIEELKRRKQELSLQGKSDSIKSVKNIVSNIKSKKVTKKNVASKKTKKKKNLSIKKGL
jgi:uncharacterized protein